MTWPEDCVSHPQSTKWLFWCHLLALMRKGLLPGVAGMAEHTAPSDETDSCLLGTYTQLRGGRLQAMQGHLGVALGNRGTSQSLRKAGFVVFREDATPWFPQKDVIGSFESFCGLPGNWNLLPRGEQELQLSPLVGVSGALIHRTGVGRAT